jgi:hypothetical protein
VTQFNIFARHDRASTKRNFLVESVDEEIARALFILDHVGWEIELSREARCFSGGEHKGELSVWEGQEGKTAILCRHHGENPPTF